MELRKISLLQCLCLQISFQPNNGKEGNAAAFTYSSILQSFGQDEDTEEYGSPISLASTIADTIKSRTKSLLKKTNTAVSSKPIVMRVEYAYCPNLTIIDTPGFVLKVRFLFTVVLCQSYNLRACYCCGDWDKDNWLEIWFTG